MQKFLVLLNTTHYCISTNYNGFSHMLPQFLEEKASLEDFLEGYEGKGWLNLGESY